ncbi:MAG: copper chaperone PCu(A)C [Hyphomicrobiales bacterium]|nr:copper chaperone PCu(A)C [Hyphomicrobiales bacterium]
MKITQLCLKNNAVLYAFILTLFAFLIIPVHSHAADKVEISKVWLRATPPSAMAAGGYLVITNNTDSDDTLVGVEFSQAGKSEIHEMKMKDGVMEMRPLKQGIKIPAGETVTLKPGGFHLMFMGMKRQLKDGQNYRVKLTFTHSGAMEIDFPVLSVKKGKKMMMQDN